MDGDLGLALLSLNVWSVGTHFCNEIDILLQYGPDNKWKRREYQVIQRDIKVIIQCLSRKSINKRKQVLWYCENHILVKKVQYHLTYTNVIPSTVD